MAKCIPTLFIGCLSRRTGILLENDAGDLVMGSWPLRSPCRLHFLFDSSRRGATWGRARSDLLASNIQLLLWAPVCYLQTQKERERVSETDLFEKGNRIFILY